MASKRCKNCKSMDWDYKVAADKDDRPLFYVKCAKCGNEGGRFRKMSDALADWGS